MVKKFFTMYLLAFSFLAGQSIIQVKLKNGKTIDGEFIGTYMEHIHLLIGENINYFKCDDIQSVTESGYINVFEYDCNKNTVTADILFPPQLNPMTGEWEAIIPDLFDPKKRKLLAKKEIEKLTVVGRPSSEDKSGQENPTEKPNLETKTILEKQIEKTKKNLQEMVNTKTKPAMSSVFYKNDEEETYQGKTKANQDPVFLPAATSDTSTSNLSEDELRRFIKSEVRKEIRKTLPYEIRRHKEQNQNKLLQNVLLGCGAWFLFMIMLS